MATLKGFSPGQYIQDYSGIAKGGQMLGSTIAGLPAAQEKAATRDDRIAGTKAMHQDTVASAEQKAKNISVSKINLRFIITLRFNFF